MLKAWPSSSCSLFGYDSIKTDEIFSFLWLPKDSCQNSAKIILYSAFDANQFLQNSRERPLTFSGIFTGNSCSVILQKGVSRLKYQVIIFYYIRNIKEESVKAYLLFYPGNEALRAMGASACAQASKSYSWHMRKRTLSFEMNGGCKRTCASFW